MLCAEAENKSYDYWFSEKIEFIEIALIFSQYNANLILQESDELINQCKDNDSYYLDRVILLKYKLLKQSENQNEADEFLFSYIDCDGVREYIVKKYTEEKNYDKAERLCLDKLKEKDSSYIWNDLLSEIYEKSRQFEKQLDIELNELLTGRAKKYDKVKILMQKLGLWGNEYNSLLLKLSNKLSPHAFGKILESEGEYEKLFDLVKKNRYLLDGYFKIIVRKFPKETYIMYSDYIIENAKTAYSRNQYAVLCKKIGDLYNYGGKTEAMQTADFLKREYPRKSALCDEIDKISKRFK
ncbi:MAG: hypothetical protein LIO62_01180 [Clostridiales bacterium]|nr:hypothetical protein [Clostridiales bacterium]